MVTLFLNMVWEAFGGTPKMERWEACGGTEGVYNKKKLKKVGLGWDGQPSSTSALDHTTP